MPRSFLYAVDEARTSSGSRPVCISTTEASDSRPKSFLDVTDVSACRVMFSFLNTAAQTCSITQVYLDDGEVMAIDVALQRCRMSLTARGGSVLPETRQRHGNRPSFSISAPLAAWRILFAH